MFVVDGLVTEAKVLLTATPELTLAAVFEAKIVRASVYPTVSPVIPLWALIEAEVASSPVGVEQAPDAVVQYSYLIEPTLEVVAVVKSNLWLVETETALLVRVTFLAVNPAANTELGNCAIIKAIATNAIDILFNNTFWKALFTVCIPC